jgi:hypothetical protein
LLLYEDMWCAAWGVVENMDPLGALRWRVSLFRNEGVAKSSELIERATVATFAHWRERHGLPCVPLTTEVNDVKTRRKRDPGRCFRRAGWELWTKTKRSHRRETLYVFLAPGERARLGIQGPVLR